MGICRVLESCLQGGCWRFGLWNHLGLFACATPVLNGWECLGFQPRPSVRPKPWQETPTNWLKHKNTKTPKHTETHRDTQTHSTHTKWHSNICLLLSFHEAELPIGVLAAMQKTIINWQKPVASNSRKIEGQNQQSFFAEDQNTTFPKCSGMFQQCRNG